MINITRADDDIIRTNSSFVATASGSFSFWLRTKGAPANNYFVMGREGNYEMYFNGSSKFCTVLFRRGNRPTVSNLVFGSDTLYHIVATHEDNGTNYQNSIYINGELDISNANVSRAVTNGILTLGNSQNGYNAVDGYLEDYRFYTRVLEPDEISTIYACRGTDDIYEGLRNRWLMNEGGLDVAVSSVYDVVSGLDASVIAGSPIYDSSEIRRRRV